MIFKPNSYSRRWFEFFHENVDSGRTDKEVNFICRCAPLPDFAKVLDICCATGRHARALAARGYSVIGADRDTIAIAKAEQLAGGPHYVTADIRQYQPPSEGFDAVIVMGQSFGHFDSATNRDLLQRLTAGLRPGGRIILDVWNPEFFFARQGKRELQTSRGVVEETKCVKGDRLFVELTYPNRERENFEWQLFTPDEMQRLVSSISMKLVISCADLDKNSPPSAMSPRIQFLLETI